VDAEVRGDSNTNFPAFALNTGITKNWSGVIVLKSFHTTRSPDSGKSSMVDTRSPSGFSAISAGWPWQLRTARLQDLIDEGLQSAGASRF